MGSEPCKPNRADLERFAVRWYLWSTGQIRGRWEDMQTEAAALASTILLPKTHGGRYHRRPAPGGEGS